MLTSHDSNLNSTTLKQRSSSALTGALEACERYERPMRPTRVYRTSPIPPLRCLNQRHLCKCRRSDSVLLTSVYMYIESSPLSTTLLCFWAHVELSRCSFFLFLDLLQTAKWPRVLSPPSSFSRSRLLPMLRCFPLPSRHLASTWLDLDLQPSTCGSSLWLCCGYCTFFGGGWDAFGAEHS